MFGKSVFTVSVVLVLGLSSAVSAQLVGWWPLDEGSGNIARDSSGNGNDGTINGAQATEGHIGGALLFDEVDDRVVVPHFAYGPEFTVVFLVQILR